MNVRLYGPDRAELHNTKTSATGTAWVTLPNVLCRAVTIFNTTGTTLQVKYVQQTGAALNGDDLKVLNLPNGASRTFGGLKLDGANNGSSALALKRADDSNTQVLVDWEAESL